MSALVTTRSPTSYQLRLTAVNCRKYPSPSVFLRMHVHKLDCQIHCFSGSNDNVTEQRRTSFSVNASSGWSGDDNGAEVLNESPQQKGWSGGIIGAAVAGVVLVGGLAFATVSISRRSSGTKKNMETLTTHQEESLTSVDQNDNVEPEKTETENDVVDDSLLEDNTSKNEDSYSYEKENENMTDNELGDNTNIERDEVAKNNDSLQLEIQEELQKSDDNNDSTDASSIDNLDEDIVSEKFELINNLKDDPNDVKIIDSSGSDVNLINPYPDVNNTAINGSNTRIEQVSLILEPVIDPIITSKTEDFENKENDFVSEENDFVDSYEIKRMVFDNLDLEKIASSASNPAPSAVSPALKTFPGKVLVPAAFDQVQGQALAALQVLKVIEGDAEPGDLCSRREYARWLVSASSALSRNTLSKVYPAMYIENVTELAFDDITPEDPDFSSIQGLAEAGLIASKLSQRDMNISHQNDESLHFCPESPLSRQDLVSWKMSLEKRLLPVADRTIFQKLSGFIDIEKINPDAWPALIADLSAGENGIVGLAFGYTRLFQPDKPVTKAQAAIALATGESSEIVSEELTRIEAESMAEKAVAAHTALMDQVQKDINTLYENDLLQEREKIIKLEKLAEETRRELERLKAEQEEREIKMTEERAAVDSQMEILLKLRHEAEEELKGIMGNKVEILYEKERINSLRTEAEFENREILRLQYELEVERKALAMARSWAEDEAKRAREQAKVLEDARDVWESKGIKVIVDKDLQNESNTDSIWVNAQKQFSIQETKSRAETLVDKLKSMATELKGKSKQMIDTIVEKIQLFVSQLKELTSKAVKQVSEVKDGVVVKVNGSVQDLQQSSVGLSSGLKEGVKRVGGDCREGVEKLTQKFKT